MSIKPLVILPDPLLRLVSKPVERSASVRVKYLDANGKPLEVAAEGLLATCLQHEIDHLNGVLFIDHISKLKRDMVVKKFKKLARDRPPPSRMVG